MELPHLFVRSTPKTADLDHHITAETLRGDAVREAQNPINGVTCRGGKNMAPVISTVQSLRATQAGPRRCPIQIGPYQDGNGSLQLGIGYDEVCGGRNVANANYQHEPFRGSPNCKLATIADACELIAAQGPIFADEFGTKFHRPVSVVFSGQQVGAVMGRYSFPPRDFIISTIAGSLRGYSLIITDFASLLFDQAFYGIVSYT